MCPCGVGVDVVQHDATQHAATDRDAIRYEAADVEAMVDGKDGTGWMDGVDETGECLDGWMDGWLVGLGLVMMMG